MGRTATAEAPATEQRLVREYRVLRPFMGEQGEYQAGDIVEVSAWPFHRPRQLTEQRYLEPLAPRWEAVSDGTR